MTPSHRLWGWECLLQAYKVCSALPAYCWQAVTRWLLEYVYFGHTWCILCALFDSDGSSLSLSACVLCLFVRVRTLGIQGVFSVQCLILMGVLSLSLSACVFCVFVRVCTLGIQDVFSVFCLVWMGVLSVQADCEHVCFRYAGCLLWVVWFWREFSLLCCKAVANYGKCVL